MLGLEATAIPPTMSLLKLTFLGVHVWLVWLCITPGGMPKCLNALLAFLSPLRRIYAGVEEKATTRDTVQE